MGWALARPRLPMTDQAPDTELTASAPGKIVLSGEYAVLDGAPAVCMAVDRRARVTISRAVEDHHTVTAPGFTSECGRFRDAGGKLEWLAGGADFALVDDVWCTAAGTISTNLSLVLDTNEFQDRKSGLKFGIGSSAALTVALTAALCELAGIDADIRSLSLDAHRKFQRGLGSGIDVACSYAGGLVEFSAGTDRVQQIAWPDGLVYALIWSGASASTSKRLETLGKQDAQPSRAALVNSARMIAQAWRDGSAHAILDEYRDYINVLREFSGDHKLGIFDAGHAELSDAADAAGVVYKPCGAGGGDVGIVFADNDAVVTAFVGNALPDNFRVLNMIIDSSGVQTVREKP